MQKKQYECAECGLHYEDDDVSKQCEAWCSETKSCNLEITQLSVEAQQNKQGD